MKLYNLSELQKDLMTCVSCGMVLLVGGIAGIFVRTEVASLIIGTVCVIFSLLGLFQWIHIPYIKEEETRIKKLRAVLTATCVMWLLLLSYCLGASASSDIQVFDFIGWKNLLSIDMGITLLVYIACYTKYEKVAK